MIPSSSGAWGLWGMAPASLGGYTREKTLGKGSFGVVYQVSKNDGKFALKVVDTNDSGAINEVKILNKVRHRNIISYYESFMQSNKLCIVMELANGTLTNYVEETGNTAIWNSCGGSEKNVYRLLGKDFKTYVSSTSYFILHTSYFILHTSYFILSYCTIVLDHRGWTARESGEPNNKYFKSQTRD